MGTPSGLLEITSPRLKEYDLDDCPAVPKWIEPDEWLGDEKTSEYPFHMMTPHPKHRLHSEFDNVPMLRKHSKVANREPVWINARDAAEKGIEDGDVVRLWNDLGETLAGAVVTERIKPDHVALSYGSWYEPEEPGEIGTMGLDGNANLLCQDNHTSSLAQGPDGKSQLVNIEKYEGDL
jgi:anaerobic selenocysteine-containing dehydrogenase